MSAVDHETAIVTRLWAIFEAHTPFTDVVKVGNRIKLLDAAERAPVKVDPNSFPKVIVSIPGRTDTLYTLGERYAMGPGASYNPVTHGVAEDIGFNVVIEIQHAMNFAAARQLVAEIMTAIRKAGPNLGVTDFRVQRVGPASVSNQHSSLTTLGIAGARPVSTSIILPVLVRVQTSDLLV